MGRGAAALLVEVVASCGDGEPAPSFDERAAALEAATRAWAAGPAADRVAL